MKRITILLVLAFPAYSQPAPVEVVSPESVGMSSVRLDALKQRLQQLLDERMNRRNSGARRETRRSRHVRQPGIRQR